MPHQTIANALCSPCRRLDSHQKGPPRLSERLKGSTCSSSLYNSVIDREHVSDAMTDFDLRVHTFEKADGFLLYGESVDEGGTTLYHDLPPCQICILNVERSL